MEYIIENERYDIGNLGVYREEAERLGQMLYNYYINTRNLISDVSIHHDSLHVRYHFLVMCKDTNTKSGGDFCIEVTVITFSGFYKFLMRWKDESNDRYDRE